MTAAVPNQNGDVVFSNQLYRIDMAIKGYGVKSGMAVTGGGAASMTVDIAAGAEWEAGVEIPYAGGTANITTADASYPRKDLICIKAGVIQVHDGTPAAADPSGDTGPTTFTPIPPALPSDETLLAEVWVGAGAVGIIDSNIHDMRVIAKTAYGAFDYGMSFEGTVSGIASAPKFECSNLTGYGNDYFVGYWAYVVWDAGGAGAAPQSEKKIITDYVSSTGQFTVAAWTAPLAAGDKVLIVHPAIMGDVIVEVGEMSDTATADDLSDIASTSVHSKLSRLLLRFSANAFAATVNGSSRADIEAMVTGLASYIKAAGAAFAPSIGGSTRADIDAALAALDAEIYTSGHTLKTPNTKIGDIARTIDLIMGSRWDSSGDLGTDVGTIITAVGTTIPNAIAAIPTTAMRGTDNALLASNYTAPDNTTIGTINTNVGDASEDDLTSVVAKLGDDAVTVKSRFDDIDTAIGLLSGAEVETTSLDADDGDNSDNVRAGLLIRYIADNLSAGGGTATVGNQETIIATLGAVDDAAAEGAVTDEDTAMAYIKQLVTAIQLIPTTAMRGTDSAFLAAVGGALDDAAAEGAVTNADTAMAYIKQLVTAIQLIPTTAMRGTDSAALASVLGALNNAAAEGAVTDADTAMAYLKQLVTAIQLIPTTAMRGTDDAALAATALTNATWTDAKAAFLDAKISDIPTTAQRGTDNAFLASVGGALDTAAVYEVAADKTVMAYIKGLIATGVAAYGTVVDVAPNTQDFDTSLTEATDNHYQLQTMIFLTGVLKGQTRDIIAYAGDSKNCSFYTGTSGSEWTDAPGNGDAFAILPFSCGRFLIYGQSNINAMLGDFSGDGGAAQDDSVKASLDIINDFVDGIEAKTDLIMPGTKFATKTSTADLTSGDLFTYTGTVGIISIIGRITTAIENAAVTVKLTITPDALAAKDICAASADIKTFTVGTMLSITGTFADAMVVTTSVGCAVSQASMITATCVTSGKISTVFNPSADNSGVIVWEILWIPQTPGATLVAA